MERTVLTVCVVFLPVLAAHATQVPHKELSELLADADHVLVGKVVKVDMVDRNGKQLRSREARTGPVLRNQLRLHVEIVKDGILKTNGDKEIKELIIPLWQAWHYRLGQWRDLAEGKTFIFLLKGKNYQRVYPGLFLRQMSDREEIERLLKQEKMQKKPRAADGE